AGSPGGIYRRVVAHRPRSLRERHHRLRGIAGAARHALDFRLRPSRLASHCGLWRRHRAGYCGHVRAHRRCAVRDSRRGDDRSGRRSAFHLPASKATRVMAASRNSAAQNALDAARASSEVRLSVEQVSYAYSPNPAQAPLFTLEASSFQARPAEIVAVLGPNASGKSTLLKLIAGALEPMSVRVLLNGVVTHSLSPRDRAQRIAMVQQESPLPFPFRAWEFVLQGRHAYGRSLRFESDQDIAIARNALAQVGGEHLTDRFMDQISGGEKQR